MTQSQARVIAAIGLLADTAKSEIFEPLGKPFTTRADINFRLQSYLAPQERNRWVLLESVVVFDEVLYDGYAFTRHQMREAMRERIEALHKHGLMCSSWPVQVYEKAASEIILYRNSLKEKGLSTVARDVAANKAEPYSESNNAFWDAAEKNYHDDLLSSQIARFSFANSDQSWERSLFYAELAKELGVSLLPRPRSFGSPLDIFSRSYSQCAHHLMLDSLKEFDEIMRPAEFSVPFPPLAEKIIRLSMVQQRAPIEVAAELRESRSAKAYRRHIADLEGELRGELRGEILSPAKLKQLMADFDRTVKKWVEEGAPNEGVIYRTRSLGIQILPAIASIATYLQTGDVKLAGAAAGLSIALRQAIFGNTLAIRVPTVWRENNYLSFVADWYN